MERREFIIKSGTVLTAAVLFSKFSYANILAGSGDITGEISKRPDPASFRQPIMKAIALGVNAPSPHNTQSWKFKIINEREMLLYVDENILLPATDPPSRQIHMGAGSFIETTVLGAQRLGYDTHVKYFPEGYRDKTDFGRKPVASLSLSKTDSPADQLAAFIEERQTNRRKYKGKMISEQEYKKLLELSGPSHSKVNFINRDMEPYLDIFYRGFEIESKTFETNEETRVLFRFNEDQRAEKGDGISIPQMGYKGMMVRLAEKSLDMGDEEKWHSEKSINLSLKNVKKGIDSTRGIVIWYTEGNEFIDWVKAGRDYVRFSLALTSQDLYSHPYNQAIQEYEEMKEIRREMKDMLSIQSPQKIQMIVRIGRSSIPYYSYRRQMNSFMKK
jgi:nitroreductase